MLSIVVTDNKSVITLSLPCTHLILSCTSSDAAAVPVSFLLLWPVLQQKDTFTTLKRVHCSIR